MDLLYLLSGVEGTELGGQGEIDHARLCQVVTALIGLKRLHEGSQVGSVHLPLVGREGDDFMSAALDGTALMDADVSGLDTDDSFHGWKKTVNDGGVGLRAPDKEEHVSRLVLAGMADLGLGLFRPFVEAVGEALDAVGLHEVLQHLGVCSVVVVAFEGYHGKAVLQGFQNSLENDLSRDFAVGSLGDDKGVGTLDDIVGDDESAAHGQAVHELGVVGPRHVLRVNSP